MAQRVDGSTGVGHVASSMLSAALDEAPHMQASEANRIANHLLDLLGLILADRTEDKRSDRATSYSTSMLRRVQEYVEKNLDDEILSPEQVASAQNVSMRYINKLFAREGTSIARWIRIRRLERCRIDLESPDHSNQSISDIAYSHGFGNISSFNRAFRSHFGLSPRTLRNSGA